MTSQVNTPSVSIAATTTTANAVLPVANSTGLRVVNTGTVPVFVSTGGASVTATTSNICVGAGETVELVKKADDIRVACITASGTATVYFNNCNVTF